MAWGASSGVSDGNWLSRQAWVFLLLLLPKTTTTSLPPDGGVSVENDDDHVDDSDGLADLSGDEDVEAGVVTSDSENNDKAAAKDWDVAG